MWLGASSNYETSIVNRIPQGRDVVTADDDDVGKTGTESAPREAVEFCSMSHSCPLVLELEILEMNAREPTSHGMDHDSLCE